MAEHWHGFEGYCISMGAERPREGDAGIDAGLNTDLGLASPFLVRAHLGSEGVNGSLSISSIPSVIFHLSLHPDLQS